MIKSGKLNEPIIFCELVSIESDTGSISKDYLDKVFTKCEILRSKGGQSVDAYEVFNSSEEIIKVRAQKVINEVMRVKLKSNLYDITHLYHDRNERSFTITLKKVDL